MENADKGAAASDASTQTSAQQTTTQQGGTTPPAGSQQQAGGVSKPKTGEEPDWLPDRLDRERKAILRSLGVENVEDAKTALAELKTRRDKDKTEHELVVSERDDLKTKVARLTKIEEVIKGRAELELKALTPEQRQAVTDVAGEDPSEQLRIIDKFKPTWAEAAKAAADATKQQQATQQTPPAPKKNTAPPRGANPSQNTQGTVSHKAIHEGLKKSNPFVAARYREAHSKEIDAEIAAEAKGNT